MQKITKGKHHRVMLYSLAEAVEYSRSLPDHRSESMRRDRDDEFYGTGKYACSSLSQLHDMASKGMSREGIEALAVAGQKLKTLQRDLNEQQFVSFYDVTGADVDVARYLDGEFDCMVDWRTSDVQASTPIVTLVMNVAVNCDITADSFTKQGQALVAVAEAIDSTGLQSEIWLDMVSIGRNGHTYRFGMRLKSGDAPFDVGALMFAFTHPAVFRGMILNAMHDAPTKFHGPMGVGNGYGHSASGFTKPEDYPADAVYIPAIQSNSQAGKFVESTLKKLGLLT